MIKNEISRKDLIQILNIIKDYHPTTSLDNMPDDYCDIVFKELQYPVTMEGIALNYTKLLMFFYIQENIYIEQEDFELCLYIKQTRYEIKRVHRLFTDIIFDITKIDNIFIFNELEISTCNIIDKYVEKNE